MGPIYKFLRLFDYSIVNKKLSRDSHQIFIECETEALDAYSSQKFAHWAQRRKQRKARWADEMSVTHVHEYFPVIDFFPFRRREKRKCGETLTRPSAKCSGKGKKGDTFKFRRRSWHFVSVSSLVAWRGRRDFLFFLLKAPKSSFFMITRCNKATHEAPWQTKQIARH